MTRDALRFLHPAVFGAVMGAAIVAIIRGADDRATCVACGIAGLHRGCAVRGAAGSGHCVATSIEAWGAAGAQKE